MHKSWCILSEIQLSLYTDSLVNSQCKSIIHTFYKLIAADRQYTHTNIIVHDLITIVPEKFIQIITNKVDACLTAIDTNMHCVSLKVSVVVSVSTEYVCEIQYISLNQVTVNVMTQLQKKDLLTSQSTF